MRKILFLFLMIAGNTQSFAQDSTWYVVNPGQYINEVLTNNVVYRYPEFKIGKVYFVGGGRAEAKMNYDRLREDFLFIGPKGDTLSIAEPTTIRLITVLNDSFYYDNGYYELIQGYESVKMAVHVKISLKEATKIGAFGQKNKGVSIDAMGKYMDWTSSVNLIANEELKFKRDDLFYLAKKGNFFFPANKKNILKEYSELRSVLQDYFNKSDPNFAKGEDVRQLCDFIQSQQTRNSP